MPRFLLTVLSVLSITAGVTAGAAQTGKDAAPKDALFGTMAALDQQLFDAYNRCDLDRFTDLFVPDVEFYHDQGGVTRTRDEVVANTKKYICGKVRRELVAGTLEVYPIKDYGAVEVGEHRFCELASGKCEGIAKFVMVWQNNDGTWRVTRVLSFGHRAEKK
ncbi:nuclear transport factor 2 family protein [Chitinimonas naiadis]